MNKKGQFFDGLSTEPAPYILGIVGAIVAFFTASGGFSGGSWNPGILMKLLAAVIGFIAGYVIGVIKSE